MEGRAPSPTVVVGGRFRLERELGRGGIAVVWRARDLVEGTPVALKLIHPEFAALDEVRVRLEREARLLTDLVHPNIARAVAVGLDSAQPYFAMELIEGQTLLDLLAERASTRRAFTPTEVATLMRQLTSAVAYAHERRVVHRDLKPANVMVTRTSGGGLGVKVLDFGVAKLLDSETFALTTQGRIVGTILYMAPEQALGTPLDERIDIFSLGVILFEILTLRRPWLRDSRGHPQWLGEPARFTGDNTIERIVERLTVLARPRPSDFGFGLGSLDAVTERALAALPEDRFSTAREFERALELGLTRVRLPTEARGAQRSEPSLRSGPAGDFSEARSRPQSRDATEPPSTRQTSIVTDPTFALGREASEELRTALAPTQVRDPDLTTIEEPELDPTPIRAPEAQAAPAPMVVPTEVDARAAEPGPGDDGWATEADRSLEQIADRTRTAAGPLVAPAIPGTGRIERPPFDETAPSATLIKTRILPERRMESHVPSPLPALALATVAVMAALAVLSWAVVERRRAEQGWTTTASSPAPATSVAEVRRPAGDLTPNGRDEGEGPKAMARDDVEPTKARSPRSRDPSGDRKGVAPKRGGAERTEQQREATHDPRPEIAQLHALLAAAEHDPGAAAELGHRLEAEAARVEDPKVRERIKRIAASSAMVGDLEGLGRALRELEAAQP